MDALTPQGQILIYLLKAEFRCAFRGGFSEMIWHNRLKTNLRQIFFLQKNIL